MELLINQIKNHELEHQLVYSNINFGATPCQTVLKLAGLGSYHQTIPTALVPQPNKNTPNLKSIYIYHELRDVTHQDVVHFAFAGCKMFVSATFYRLAVDLYWITPVPFHITKCQASDDEVPDVGLTVCELG